MKLLLLTLTTIGALVAGMPAQAGGWNNHGRGHGHYGHHYRPYSHHYNYGHHRHRSHHNGYRYIGAGLLLGAVASHMFRPRVVTRTRVVYRDPPREAIYDAPAPAPQAVTPLPAERPDVFLRRDPDGDCWLIEREADGTEIITPQEQGVCG